MAEKGIEQKEIMAFGVSHLLDGDSEVSQWSQDSWRKLRG